MTLDLTGYKVGELTVIRKQGREYIPTSRVYRTLWLCKCICGKEVIKQTQALRGSKASNTCGCCEWQIHHNEAYVSWCSMKQRCDYKGNKDYYRYGGRGIKYAESWKSFINFYKDMGDPPIDKYTGERMSLDRINNSGNYELSNCRWATRNEQQLNKGD